MSQPGESPIPSSASSAREFVGNVEYQARKFLSEKIGKFDSGRDFLEAVKSALEDVDRSDFTDIKAQAALTFEAFYNAVKTAGKGQQEIGASSSEGASHNQDTSHIHLKVMKSVLEDKGMGNGFEKLAKALNELGDTGLSAQVEQAEMRYRETIGAQFEYSVDGPSR